MQYILKQLQELDSLYCSTSLEAYEKTWQTVDQQVQQTFPGFTIAYAEIYNSGREREAQGSMHHVLVPNKPLH